MNRLHLTTIILLIFVSNLWSQQLAFPGAEGYGKYTKGGRGGVVYEVTNLNDAGTGSLRAAVEASGPRTVVFRVSGTIKLTKRLTISNPFITIAGQTAPGDGICISQHALVFKADEIIVRYIRVRLGDEAGNEDDAISGRYFKNIILDHVSASWSVDETVSIYHCENVTIQWCIVSESLYLSNHGKGKHGYGAIWGSNYSTYHHNLLAHHSSRNPRFASGCGNTDYRNNVLYNWGFNSCYGAEKVQQNSTKYIFSNVNLVANYYKAGPATSSKYKIAQPSSRNRENDYGKWYVANNYVYGSAVVTENNWNGGIQPDDGAMAIPWLKLNEPWPAMEINQQKAEDAFISVLANAGATLPKRDVIDLRIVDETKKGYATYGATYGAKRGIIDSQGDVGGWPVLNSLAAPADTDKDGMPDDWEDNNALDKTNPNDRNTIAENGYTMLELYLNSIEFNFPVTNIYFTRDDDKNIQVVWDDIYIGEDGFIIEKTTNGTDYMVVDTVDQNIFAFTDTTQSVNANLKYRVFAYQSSYITPNPEEFIINSSIEIAAVSDIKTGDSIQMQAILLPENSGNKIVNWSVREQDEMKAGISESGMLVALDTGMIQVTVQTTDGSDISAQLDININPKLTGIGSIKSHSFDFAFFPNPSDGSVTFYWNIPVSSKLALRIYDLNGVVVKNLLHQQTVSEVQMIEWDGNNNFGDRLSPGYYLCEIQIDGAKTVQPLIRK